MISSVDERLNAVAIQPPPRGTGQQEGARSRVLDVTIIVPLLNEEASIRALYDELTRVMGESGQSFEIILIDDGSTDGTFRIIERIAQCDSSVTAIQFTRRFGQTAALSAGIEAACGRVIVPIDGDLQNDPRDIPRLIHKLDQQPGWDIVSGWRKQRHDRLLTRRLPSRCANRLIARLTWTPEIHDFGCSLKAYRAEVLRDVHLYGEMHRFLPAICKWRGARVTEIVVNHRPRASGASKYGLKRVLKVGLDLLTVKFFGDYLNKPLYFFGKITVAAVGLALTLLAVAVAQKAGYLTEHGEPVMLNNNVLVVLSAMIALSATMFLLMGVIAELLIRIYHESHGMRPYKIRQCVEGRNRIASVRERPAARSQAPADNESPS